MFLKNSEAKKFDLTDGVLSKILGRGGGLMVVENHFDKGAVAPIHTHIHEQAGYVVKGKFEFEISGEKKILEPGDSLYVEGNVPHGCVAIEEGVILDIFSPQRDEFLERAK